MNILITTPIFPPEARGPATYTYNLSQKLKAKSQKCVVITFTQSPEQVPGVKVISINQAGGTIARQARLLRAIIREGRNADVIYAQGADVVGFASVLAGKTLRKPVAVKFVGDLPEELRRDFNKSSFMTTLATFASLHLADKIAFPAKHLQEKICQKYHLNKSKTTVIYNAV